MARAKQTNRAEARRRYRQAVAQSPEEADDSADSGASGGPSGPSGRTGASAGQGRPSISAAFREAYHPAHFREDLAALPRLLTLATPTRIPLTRTVLGIPWFLVSAFLVIVGFAALLVDPGQGALLFQLLSYPPGGPTLPVLLVGFMATRASYLQGLLIGLLDLVLVGIFVAVVPTAPGQTANLSEILTSAAVTGLPTSVLFAASAAWYRRFLVLSSPRRMQPPKGASRGRGGRPGSRR